MTHATDESIVKMVSDVIDRGIVSHASDIHLEPAEDSLRVRFRIDGILFDQEPLSVDLAEQLISRIKVLSNILQKKA